jgi:hypothetical protein
MVKQSGKFKFFWVLGVAILVVIVSRTRWTWVGGTAGLGGWPGCGWWGGWFPGWVMWYPWPVV